MLQDAGLQGQVYICGISAVLLGVVWRQLVQATKRLPQHVMCTLEQLPGQQR